MKISNNKFKRIVEEEADKIISSLPDELQAPAMSVIFIVSDRAEPDMDDDDNEVMGLYEGTPLTERSLFDGEPDIPDRITLYRYAIAGQCRSMSELREEIRLTLLHELGHLFGFEEDDLEKKGV